MDGKISRVISLSNYQWSMRFLSYHEITSWKSYLIIRWTDERAGIRYRIFFFFLKKKKHSLSCADVVHIFTSAVTQLETLVRPTDSQCWGDVQGLHASLSWWQGPKNFEKYPRCERGSGTSGHHQKKERCLPSLLMFRPT